MADSLTPYVDTQDPDGVERLVGMMIDESEMYISRQVRQDRIDAADVYKGRPYGNEEEGRSQVVLKVVRRVVARILPSLMRIFTGPERYVEFKSRNAFSEEKARQATDYVNYVITEDNPGFSILYAAFKDALVRRTGWIKWGVREISLPETTRYTGLSETDLLALLMDKDVQLEEIEPEEPREGEFAPTPQPTPDAEGDEEASPPAASGAGPGVQAPPASGSQPQLSPPAASGAGPGVQAPPASGSQPQLSPAPAGGAPPTFSALVTRGTPERRVWIRECPGEEILWDRDARDVESAKIIDHVRFDMPVYELEAMGYKYEDLEDNIGMGPMNLAANTALMESDSRRQDMGILRTELLQDPHTRPIRYDEAYVRMDYQGKGVRLYKVCMVGVAHKMLGEPEPVSHIPFVYLTPDPEPHTLEGSSITDDVSPLQKIESMIARGVLDSLVLTLSPAMLIQDGEVNVKDLLNTEVGRYVRTTTAPAQAVQELTHSFVGKEALPVLAYFDHEIENVTGQSDASQGLDADVLQSTTKLAVAGTFKAAQEQTEMIARVFADQLKYMYKGLLRTIIEHQDKPRTIRLRGKYVEVDPRAWDADMDVIVNVGLGQGLVEDRMNLLVQIAAKQEQIMATLGPTNPLVKLSQYRNTLARIIEMAGFKNAAEFFTEIDPQQEQAAAQAAAQAPQGSQDPNAALAQAEVQKATIAAQAATQRSQVEAQGRSADRQIEAFKAQHAAKMEELRLAADIALKTKELESKSATAINREQLRADIERETKELDAKTKLMVEGLRAAVATTGHHAGILKGEIAADSAQQVATTGAQASVAKAIQQREARVIGTQVVNQANGDTEEA